MTRDLPADRPSLTAGAWHGHQELITELRQDARHLAGLVRHPVVRTSGASGVLNPDTVSVIRVWGSDVDTDALFAELTTLPVTPDLLVHADIDVDDPALLASGWHWHEDVVTVRHDRPWSLDATVPVGYAVRPIDRSELSAIRSLLDDCFGPDELDEHLPDEVLEVPGLRLFAAGHDNGDLAATIGIRPTRTGALLFSLATSRQHRRQGLADCLVAHAARCSARQGASHVRADVTAEVLPFYQRLGFYPYSRWRRYEPVHGAPTPTSGSTALHSMCRTGNG